MNEYYIAPDSDIYVLTGVPLDNNYEHTISWLDSGNPRVDQANYFMSKAKFHFDNCTYERRERLWCKIEKKADDLYDCNYLMFRNTAFGDKWFYAFITGVEYVNNNTSRITFEIDVMQTWLRGINRDYTAEMCFVERSHTATDTMYEHLVPEDIVKDREYVVDEEIDIDFNECDVMICATEILQDDDFVTPPGAFHYGVFGAVAYMSFRCKTAADIARIMDFIKTYIKGGKENSIVSIQMVPRRLTQGAWSTTGNVEYDYKSSVSLTVPIPGLKLGGKNSYFVPRNNKMYTYPFNRIKVNNEQGIVKDYAWELFTNKDERGKFDIYGTFAWQPGLVILPKSYKGAVNNMEDAVTLENFPVCPWGGDAYLAWWAQNTPNFALNAMGGAASAGAIAVALGGATINPMLLATGVGGLATALGKTWSSIHASEHQSNTQHVANNTSLLLPVTKNYRFVVTRESLRSEMLRIYDAYFTKFGYARKTVTVPPELNRKRWTYVKTVGFEAVGKINATDAKKIGEIYDKGITFWRNPDEIGRYELDNSPL